MPPVDPHDAPLRGHCVTPGLTASHACLVLAHSHRHATHSGQPVQATDGGAKRKESLADSEKYLFPVLITASNEQIGRQQTTSWDLLKIPQQAAANRCLLEHVTCSAPISCCKSLREFTRATEGDCRSLVCPN
ncbi:hypothetical protein ElyMa_004242100 [Elysia marginata]|uniref:Uncharacterized protein n=1 Tax=Elysia marginata TaxID=1093978 RepID=A0AAV4GUQ7_9GAST|nr:hypothetical protein ElyMa_004242100 [Elysia marginata]